MPSTTSCEIFSAAISEGAPESSSSVQKPRNSARSPGARLSRWKRLHVGLHVAEADRLQQVAELRADERIAAELELVVVERHPVAQRVRAVGIEEEGRVQHLVAHDRRARA